MKASWRVDGLVQERHHMPVGRRKRRSLSRPGHAAGGPRGNGLPLHNGPQGPRSPLTPPGVLRSPPVGWAAA